MVSNSTFDCRRWLALAVYDQSGPVFAAEFKQDAIRRVAAGEYGLSHVARVWNAPFAAADMAAKVRLNSFREGDIQTTDIP